MILSAPGHLEVIDRWPFLTVSVEGPWDRACVEAQLKALMPVIASYDMRGNWAAIAVVTGVPQMTPDALALYRSFIRDHMRGRTKRVAAAMVCDPEAELRVAAQAAIGQAYDGVCPFGVFEDLTAAKEWLRPFLKP